MMLIGEFKNQTSKKDWIEAKDVKVWECIHRMMTSLQQYRLLIHMHHCSVKDTNIYKWNVVVVNAVRYISTDQCAVINKSVLLYN